VAVFLHTAWRPDCLANAQLPNSLASDIWWIRVGAAGSCGTDLHFRNMGRRFKDRCAGHERRVRPGKWVAVGSHVTPFSMWATGSPIRQ